MTHREFFVVWPSGYVRFCNHSPKRLEHCDEIERLKKNDYWRQFVMKDYVPKGCGGCEHLSDCVGGCREAAHVVSGSVDGPDPLML